MNEIVRVRREAIVACMRCPICKKMLKEATTISECLHTFCRKCICRKFSDDELECCPVCNIDLGCLPEEKLRPDHNLQDLIAKIFPSKRRKLDPPEAVSSNALPAKRKERSLSSLGVSTPRVSPQTSLTGRRPKSTTSKTLQGSSLSVEKQMKKEENYDDTESCNSRETLTVRQNSSNGKPCSPYVPDIGTEIGTETGEQKVDLWKPLNFLVEVANRTESPKFIPQESASKLEPADVSKARERSSRTKRRSKDENNNADLHSHESMRLKKFQRQHQKKLNTSGRSHVSPQAVLDATSIGHERRLNPIWCSLVASKDQEDHQPLPQISASFLRIKDGNVSVSLIQKYLMRKLDLPSQDEIEIRCMGEPVVPALQLHKLTDSWLRTMSTSEKISATIGSSAKEFVMVLGYARKNPSE